MNRQTSSNPNRTKSLVDLIRKSILENSDNLSFSNERECARDFRGWERERKNNEEEKTNDVRQWQLPIHRCCSTINELIFSFIWFYLNDILNTINKKKHCSIEWRERRSFCLVNAHLLRRNSRKQYAEERHPQNYPEVSGGKSWID